MPIYEYKCTACGNRFTEMRKMSERATAQCPSCRSVGEQQISRVAAPVRGRGGWSSPASATSEPSRSASSQDRLNGVDTSTLPFVGPDGRLYSSDGKKVLRG